VSPRDRQPTDEDLQRQLRDLLTLAVVGDHVRWVLTGPGASELADWLGDAIPEWRAWADQVAKQLVDAGVAPDGRVRSLARDLTLNWVPDGWLETDEARRLLGARLRRVAGWACHRHSEATGRRAEVLDVVCSGLRAQLHSRPDLNVAGSQEVHLGATRSRARVVEDDSSPTAA
jgi:starvation-inducible DNA-binding protein